MIERKLQVFVSSTYNDLIDERQAAVEAILNAGHIPAGMELFKSGKSQQATICKWIDESDVYMLILGGRYGTVEEKSGKSYTHLEFEYALSINIPLIVIVLSESYLHMKAAKSSSIEVFESKNKKKYDRFKNDIQKNVVIRQPKSIMDLKSVIGDELKAKENELTCFSRGWVRSENVLYETENMDEQSITNLKSRIDQKLVEKHIDMQYRDIAKDFYSAFQKMLYETIVQGTFILRYTRHININIYHENRAMITMKNSIEYANIKDKNFYRSSPMFPKEWQAKSYKHLEFKIDNENYLDEVQSQIVECENCKQMEFVVKNTYPLSHAKDTTVIFHKVSYEVETDNFYQLLAMIYPCRDFDLAITVEGEYKDKYSIILGTMEYFNISNFSEKTQIRDKHTCVIRMPHWVLAGSGYTFTLQRV